MKMLSIRNSQAIGARAGYARASVPRKSRAISVQPKALFGWGKKDEEGDSEKEEAFRAQQEMLRKRRSGEALKEAYDRRRKVKGELESKRDERQSEKAALAEGRIPESLNKWKPYDKETTEKAKSGIVVPLLPFGIPKYDAGERFDLRSPYADEGWVDPEETDMWSGIKKLGSKVLNLSGKQPESQEGKPVIWASQYAQYERDQKKKKDEKNEKKK